MENIKKIYKLYKIILLTLFFFNVSYSQSLTWLGTLGGNVSIARAISPNGSIIVGLSDNSSGYTRAFLWTAQTGMIELPTPGNSSSSAFDVNDNGIVVGQAEAKSAMWDNGYISLADDEEFNGQANGISNDGLVVSGWAGTFNGQKAFRWTENEGRQFLSGLGENKDKAIGISDDGLIIIGSGKIKNGNFHAVKWTQLLGITDLGTTGGFDNSVATCTNSDGSVIAGNIYNTLFSKRPFRWTLNSGMVQLPALSQKNSIYDMTSNGFTLVGTYYDVVANDYRACRWKIFPTASVKSLYSLYSDLLEQGSYFVSATGISSDGRYITGYGYNSQTGKTEAFLLDTQATTDISDRSQIPAEFKLYQNYPNPFNPSTVIKFSIPYQSYVTLKVYDLLGKEIVTLLSEKLSAGEYQMDFTAENLQSGLYFYKLTAGNFNEVKKMILMK